MPVLQVRKDDLREVRAHEQPAAEPGDGEAVLEVDRFALTANNVTYGVVGEQMAYWSFFPAGDGWGQVPVWGFATVAASRHPDIAAGERVYGYLPMGGRVTVRPDKVSGAGFTDMAAHRQPMAQIYNQYHRLGAAADDERAEDLRALFEPLFTTSFLIEDMFRRADWHGAERVILTSASSKTALALAHVARDKSPGIERVGLTSLERVGFVRGTGLYDRVLRYDEIESLGDRPGVSVDFAGNRAALARIHTTLGEALRYSCIVGVTHWEQRGGGGDMPGPQPILFFAPHAAEALIGEIGPGAFQRERGAAWGAFIGEAADWITIERGDGADSAARAWRALVDGEARADVGYVMRLS